MCKARITFSYLNRKGSRLHVELDMLFLCESVNDDASLLFIPRLEAESRSVELPMVLVAGKRRYRTFKRALWGLGKDILHSYNIRKVFKGVNPRLITYPYRICLDYEDWMSAAKINLSETN